MEMRAIKPEVMLEQTHTQVTHVHQMATFITDAMVHEHAGFARTAWREQPELYRFAMQKMG